MEAFNFFTNPVYALIGLIFCIVFGALIGLIIRFIIWLSYKYEDYCIKKYHVNRVNEKKKEETND